MRPWEREQGTPPPDSPPRQLKGSLSSMVVKPTEEELGGGGGGEDSPAKITASETREEARGMERRRREEIPSSDRRPRSQRSRDGSGYEISDGSLSPSRQQRAGRHRYDPDADYGYSRPMREYRDFEDDKDGGKYVDRFASRQQAREERFRDVSPSYGRGRGRMPPDYSPPYGPRRGGGRFRGSSYGRGAGRGRYRDYAPSSFENERVSRPRDFPPNYEQERGRFRDYSPSYERERPGRRYADPPPSDYELERGRYRDISPPPQDRRRDDGFYDKNYREPDSDSLSFRGESTNRNNPNIPPRVGDWICKNPTCGNINFARREYCNSCNKYRFDHEDARLSGSQSPRRIYPGSTRSLDEPPPRGIPIERSFNPKMSGYRSPPHDWERRDGPRDPPVARRGGRFPSAPMQRGMGSYQDEATYQGRGNGKFDRPSDGWNRGERSRHDYLEDTIEYEQDHWHSRERSRTPVRGLPIKDGRRDAYMGRGRGRGRGETPLKDGHRDAYDGRGLVQPPMKDDRRDSYAGRGRGDPPPKDGRRDLYAGRGRADPQRMHQHRDSW